MKNDVVMYEKVYEILKNKIHCGLLPEGTRLPSRADLCEEFHTSEKTVRHALKLLEKEGLVTTEKRKRPVVATNYDPSHQAGLLSLKRAEAVAADDILRTGILLCYPLNGRGMAMCAGDEWDIPQTIVDRMDPEDATEFWRLSNRFWRFFISRLGNELILRTVDSLGFAKLDLRPGTYKLREAYRTGLNQLIQTMKHGGSPERIHFDDLYTLYGVSGEENEDAVVFQIAPDSFMKDVPGELGRQLRRGQERYSSVYLDILGLIVVGRYRPGDRLPSHEELMKIYGVSIDTTIKAVRTLESWGVVAPKRGQGIFVAKDLEGLKKIKIDPEVIASHVRRFLDCLELLSLTVEGVAVHAAEHASKEEAVRLRGEIENLWNKEYLYQISPFVLLDFIVEHIQYETLRVIYDIMRQNYHIGRSIPRLVRTEKTPASCDIFSRCVQAADYLTEGRAYDFAAKAAGMFHMTHRLIVEECKRLGYWEAAMNVYDGSALWK